jgi:hypothetical protein
MYVYVVTQEDQVLIVHVMVINSMWEKMILSVIIWLRGAIVQLSTNC